MSAWFFLAVIPLACSERISSDQNMKLKQYCGKQHNGDGQQMLKHYGGKDVRSNEYSWIATIVYQPEGASQLSYCSGSLVSPRHVLTAAHCVISFKGGEICEWNKHNSYQGKLWMFQPRFMNVSRFGVYIGSSCDLPEECHRRHRVQRVWYNDMYDVCRHSHDIAVIELEDTIEASEAVPICMPTEQSQLAEQLQAAGSGVDPSLDIDMYGKYRRKVKVVGLTLSSEDSHTKMIHVRARDASLCQGDSGGPLFQLDDRMRSTVVGVASYGPRCLYAPQELRRHTQQNQEVDPNIHYLFVDIRHHIQWICERTGVCPVEEGKSPKKSSEPEVRMLGEWWTGRT